jgi:hypothetical protein
MLDALAIRLIRNNDKFIITVKQITVFYRHTDTVDVVSSIFTASKIKWYRVYRSKFNLTTFTYYCIKIKSEGPLLYNRRSQSTLTLESRSRQLLGHCSRQLRTGCAGANMLYSRAERVFILLEHYVASKESAAGREAFSMVYP